MREVIDRPEARDPANAGAPEPAADESLSRLFHFTGPRPAAPAEMVAEVKRLTRPAWQAKVRAVARRRRRRRRWTMAAAAVLILSAAGALHRLAPGPRTNGTSSPGAASWVAEVQVSAGVVDLYQGGSHTATAAGTPAAGTMIAAGSVIETGPRGLATLRLAGGTSARLDAGTVLRLATASALEIERGALYLDTGAAPVGARLEVTTPYGVARDVGTQFEVRLLEDALRIQVREGEVEVDLGEESYAAGAGTALSIGAGGAVTSEQVPAHGPAWSWILNTPVPFELEGRTLGEFLEWLTRETGWRPHFSDPSLEQEVMGTALHGSIAGVRPDQAPDLVLPSSGLRYRVEDGTMLIEEAGGASHK